MNCNLDARALASRPRPLLAKIQVDPHSTSVQVSDVATCGGLCMGSQQSFRAGLLEKHHASSAPQPPIGQSRLHLVSKSPSPPIRNYCISIFDTSSATTLLCSGTKRASIGRYDAICAVRGQLRFEDSLLLNKVDVE